METPDSDSCRSVRVCGGVGVCVSRNQASQPLTHSPPTMRTPEHSFKALGSNLRLLVCLFFKTIKMSCTQWGNWGVPEGRS